MKFQVHTIDTAPEGAKQDLQAAKSAFGFVPNLLGVLAEAPIALKAYIELTGLLEKASLDAVEQQLMMLAGSFANECAYCMAAHSTSAKMVKMPAPMLEALRAGHTLSDPKLEALRSFTVDIVNSRGRVSDDRIQEFLSAGYTQKNVLEVVFAVAMKTLSNYANHLAETPVDRAFAAHAWTPKPPTT